MKTVLKNIFTIKTLMLFVLVTMMMFGVTANGNNHGRYSTKLKADIAYDHLQFNTASNYYKQYLLDQPDNHIKMKLADCYWQMRDYDSAIKVYDELINDTLMLKNVQVLKRYAELKVRSADYKSAVKFLSGIPDSKRRMMNYEFLSQLNKSKEDSNLWVIKSLSINSQYRDYAPFYYQNKLYFSSNKPEEQLNNSFKWDGANYSKIWYVPINSIKPNDESDCNKNIESKTQIKKNTQLADVYECADVKPIDASHSLFFSVEKLKSSGIETAKLLPGLEKFKYNIATVSLDKYNHIYFSANQDKDTRYSNNIQIYEGKLVHDKACNINKITQLNADSFNVMHPTVNTSGTLIVCSSNKVSGNYDLYYSYRSDTSSTWSTLQVIDPNINTTGNEVFPYLSPDGYLYYSSDGGEGFGGLDIYRTKLIDGVAKLGNIEHLSYPINTQYDDFAWTQTDSTGNMGFFSSDRLNSMDDIFSFERKKIVQKYLKGIVLENNTKTPIKDALVFLYNNLSDSVIIAKTNENGKYELPIDKSGEYLVKAVSENHLSDCFKLNINIHQGDSDQYNSPQSLLLDKYKTGVAWKLNNIHYDFDKYNIRADASPTLDSLIFLLNEQPIKIELGSHTDSRGTSSYNQKLSQLRAESVVKYLVDHGISPDRIKAKGYGESQLINKCPDGAKCSEAEHQLNRRTEVKVTGQTPPLKSEDEIDTRNLKGKLKVAITELPILFFKKCQ